MNNFDLRKFLTENKLTSNSKLLKESEYEPGSIAPADLYYSDKHGKLVAMDDVDDKYHDSLELVYHKGDEIEGPMDEKLERSPDDRKPENLKLHADYDKGGKYYSEEGAEAFRIQPFKLNDIEYTKDQAMKQGKYIVGLEGEELKKFISDYIAAWEADKGDTESGKTFKEDLEEDARTDAEQEGYKDGFDDAKDDVKDALSKMKVSELKAKIKETILAELTLAEADEEVDVDIDVEDKVEVEAGADDIEIERKGVKAKVEVGLSPEEEIVQDSLKAAMDAAEALGSDKLADQIGNTITFFTREFVVGQNTD